jgi:hypothetical protein
MTPVVEAAPVWLVELRATLERPYTPEELEQIRESFEAADRINAGKQWPSGTFQHLLDLAHAEDEEDDTGGG